MLMKIRRGFLKNNKGAVAVEFALAAPIFIIFIMGLIDFGRLFLIRSTLQFAVEETTRFAMVNPTTPMATLEAYAMNRVAIPTTDMNFTATPTTLSGVDYITVSGTRPFNFIIPILSNNTITLGAQSRVPISIP